MCKLHFLLDPPSFPATKKLSGYAEVRIDILVVKQHRASGLTQKHITNLWKEFLKPTEVGFIFPTSPLTCGLRSIRHSQQFPCAAQPLCTPAETFAHHSVFPFSDPFPRGCKQSQNNGTVVHQFFSDVIPNPSENCIILQHVSKMVQAGLSLGEWNSGTYFFPSSIHALVSNAQLAEHRFYSYWRSWNRSHFTAFPTSNHCLETRTIHSLPCSDGETDLTKLSTQRLAWNASVFTLKSFMSPAVITIDYTT